MLHDIDRQHKPTKPKFESKQPFALATDSQNDGLGFVSRLTMSFKSITAKAMEGVSKAAFDIYGTSSDAYGQSVNALFDETYFLEDWIVELLQKDRSSREEVWLSKMVMVSRFLYEGVIDIVLSDMKVLIDSYF
jgi:hypothetical protein